MRKALVWACVWGIACGISPGLAMVGALFWMTLWLIEHHAEPAEAPFLLGLFGIGVGMRFILLAGTYAFLVWTHTNYYGGDDLGGIPALFADSGFSAVRGWRWVQFLLGELRPLEMEEILKPYGRGGHLVLIAGFHALFGFSPFLVTTLNCFFSVWTGLVVYSLVRRWAAPQAAQWAALLTTFFPSLILWSLTNLKDPTFIFWITLLPWAWWFYARTQAKRYIALSLLSLLCIAAIRPHFFPAVLISSWVALLVLTRPPLKRRWILLTLATVLLLFLKGKIGWFLWERAEELLVAYHRGVVSTGGLTYQLFEGHVYDPSFPIGAVGKIDLLRAFAIGWIHVLLEPFPWKIGSVLSLIALPQIMVWYLLLLAAVFGMRGLLRKETSFGLVLMIHLFLLGSVLVFGAGNVGTDFRIRDTLTPLVLALSALGLTATASPGA